VAAADAFDAIASYLGASGKDDIDIDGVAASATIKTFNGDDDVTFSASATTGNSATVELGGGDDTVTLDDSMTAGSITLDGGAGDDTFNLGNTSNVSVTIKVDAGDFSVTQGAITDGNIADADAEQISDFDAGIGNDLIDLSALGLSGVIVTRDIADLNNAWSDITDVNGNIDVIYMLDDSDNVELIMYDNGANGVGVLQFVTAVDLSTTLGEDVLI